MTSAYMTSATYVAASITHLVSVEVIEGLISTLRMWTGIAVMWIKAVINVAAEVVATVEPRPGSEEYTAVEPFGTVVPIWGAVVWCDVVVAVGANRLCSDIDRDLGGRSARDAQHCGNQSGKGKDFPITHMFLLTLANGNSYAKVCSWGGRG
jgi:hypothetical protein